MEKNVQWKNYLGKGAYTEKVYSLDEATIDKVVPQPCPNGNYKILRHDLSDNMARVIYIGRVADRTADAGLADRLKEHIGEWPGVLYFDFNVKETPLQAYYQECLDYHNWQPIYNSVHPAKLPGRDDKCPVCGE